MRKELKKRGQEEVGRIRKEGRERHLWENNQGGKEQSSEIEGACDGLGVQGVAKHRR